MMIIALRFISIGFFLSGWELRYHFFDYFCNPKQTVAALSPAVTAPREESPGSTESPYFLTGRDVLRKVYATASATENIPQLCKGENAR